MPLPPSSLDRPVSAVVTQALVTRNTVDAGLTPQRVRGMYTGRYRQAGALPVNSALLCQTMRASLSIMPAQRS